MNRGRGARLPSAHTVFSASHLEGALFTGWARTGEGRGGASRERGLGRGSEGGVEDSPFIKKQSALIYTNKFPPL